MVEGATSPGSTVSGFLLSLVNGSALDLLVADDRP